MKTWNGYRKSVKWALVALFSVAALCAAVGEEKKCPVSANVRGRENIEWSISYAYGLTDATCDLPRVLLIGDSICNGYQRGVRERLKGKMNVTYWVSSYCVTSPAYLPLLSIYLDEAKYDVIHFNNGLHSLSATTDAWAKGLKATLAYIREKQPQAKIVWCSSTPLTDSGKTAKCRELNAAAARVVAELGGIATDDLFALCDPLDRTENWCDEYHFRPEAKARQADQVASVALSAASLIANAERGLEPLFYNIAPFSPGEEAVVAADMREYVARTGNRKVLYSLTLHPEGVPAMKKVDAALASYRRLKEELKGSDVELGILLQSILGHWPRTDKEVEPWQRTVNQSGKEVRFCWLDPRFQDYIRTVAKRLAAEEPCFILGDDDIRAFSPEAECFCPLHVAEFNRRRGTSYTSAQMRATVSSSKPGDPDFETFMALQREQVNGVARLIREGIDSVNPAIPAGTCMPGWELRFNDQASRAIAAKGQPPVMRLANGSYHEWMRGMPEFVKTAQRTQAMYEYHRDSVGAIISEADTYPHNLWSRSSTSMHAHLVMTFFAGLKGAKLWFVNAHKNGYPVNRNYTDRISENSGLYRTLARELSGSEFIGLIEPCLTNFPSWHPIRSVTEERFVSRKTWATEMLGRMGVPSTVSRDYGRDGIWTLAGEHAVSRLSDGDLKKILSHRVLVDGRAAVALTKRGLDDLIGARALPDPVLFTSEVDVVGGSRYPLSKTDDVPKLELLDGARRLTSLVYFPYAGAVESEDAGPASSVFENRLGGKVVVSAFHTGVLIDRIRNEPRQEWLFRMVDLLAGKQPIPCVANRQDVMVLAARKPDGDVLMAVFNLNFDPMSSIDLRVKGEPEISLLDGDGNWSKADVVHKDGCLNIRYGIPCYGVAVLRLRTKPL